MREYSTEINLVLTCKQEEIPKNLKLCETHISQRIGKNQLELVTMARIKWIIGEMLSNTVKHSKVDKCLLNIIISDEELIIEKEDSGKPLVLNDFDSGKSISWPSHAKSEDLNFQIYHNGTDSLRVRTTGTNKAIFFIDQLRDTDMPVLLDDISEHFGLLIITKSSDEFTYEFDTRINANRFRSHIYIK